MFQNRKPLRESTTEASDMPASGPTRSEDERPRYKLTQPAYFSRPVIAKINGKTIEGGDLFLEAGDEVETDDPPGPHMQPLNDAAREMWDLHRPVFRNPLDDFPVREGGRG